MRHQATQTRAVADDAEQRAAAAAAAAAGSFGKIIQTGTFTLLNGVSPAVPATGVVTGGLSGGSRVLLMLVGANASTALGLPSVAVTAGVGFQVTSLEVATPAATQTGDQSTYGYVIINPAAIG